MDATYYNTLMTLQESLTALTTLPTTDPLPAVFVGHGSPMNAIEDNEYSRAWHTLGSSLPTPRAVLVVSAHWLTDGSTMVHTGTNPKTIHDFWGFPKELYDISYPAPGAPEHAHTTQEAVTATHIQADTEWGLDHGTWSVLRHMYPSANIPTFQLSIDFSKGGSFHYEVGQELRKLRSHGVLIMGSGNLVHNLGRISFAENATPFDWALEFDATAKDLLSKRSHDRLINHHELGHSATLSIPTPDHFWPLLYVLGASTARDNLSFPVEGIAHSSISMRTVLYSAT